MVALHDLNAALRFADRVLVLCEGRAVAEGAPPQVLTAELIAEVYGVRAAVARTENGGMAILPESAIEAGR